MIMDERAVEAAIRTLGREVTEIKKVIERLNQTARIMMDGITQNSKNQDDVINKIVEIQGRLIDLLEKLVKKDQK